MLMNKRQWVAYGRIMLGILVFAALFAQAVRLQRAGVFRPLNYFGYFTNLSNIIAGGVLIIGGSYLLSAEGSDKRLVVVRGAATLYMAVTGIIYITLLSNEDLGLLMPWVNIVTHIVMPLAVVADWLLWPPGSGVSWRSMSAWFIFPAIYLPYTLARGHATDWYPYPFLNPAKTNGYLGVAAYCLGILVVFGAVSWALAYASRRTFRSTK